MPELASTWFYGGGVVCIRKLMPRGFYAVRYGLVMEGTAEGFCLNQYNLAVLIKQE
jgi:hypothetical protein